MYTHVYTHASVHMHVNVCMLYVRACVRMLKKCFQFWWWPWSRGAHTYKPMLADYLQQRDRERKSKRDRERERERERESACVCEREGDRARARESTYCNNTLQQHTTSALYYTTLQRMTCMWMFAQTNVDAFHQKFIMKKRGKRVLR